MKKFLFCLTIFLATFAYGQLKFSALPTGAASTSGVNDSFPYVQTSDGTNHRMLLSDLINLPSMVSAFGALIPSQTGQGGAILQTNGTSTSWLSPQYVPMANGWAAWDSNSNFSADNLLSGYTSTATAATTTTLTVASTQLQYFTGTTTQSVVLPTVTTLGVKGFSFTIVNLSTGNVTVKSSGGNTIQVVASNSQSIVTAIALTGTTAASWSNAYSSLSGVSLPSQTGQSGKFLTTDGTSTSWGTVTAPVWGAITGTLSDQTDLYTALGLLAPLASPNFTGTVGASTIQGSSGTLDLAADTLSNASYVIFDAINSYIYDPSGNLAVDAKLRILKDSSAASQLIWNSSGIEIANSIFQDGIAAPALSASGKGKIYFDSTDNIFYASQNGQPYVPMVGFVPGSPVTIKYFTTAFGTVCSASTCGITTNTTGVTVTRSGSGTYQINFPSGLFSSPPACTFQSYDGSNAINSNQYGPSITSTAYPFKTVIPGTGFTDTYGDIICSSGNSQSVVNSLQGDTSWIPYTLAVTGTSSNPSLGTTSVNNLQWRRVDDSADIHMELVWTGAGGAGSGTYLFNLPPGLAVDTTKVTCGNPKLTLGRGTVYGVASDMYTVTVYCYDSTHLAMQTVYATGNNDALGSGAIPLSNGTGSYSFNALVPISGWQGNQRAPTLNGSITTHASGAWVHENAYINSSGTSCSIGNQSGSWIASASYPSVTGDCLLTLNTGIFSSPPNCVCNGVLDIATQKYECSLTIQSAGPPIAIEVHTSIGTGLTDVNRDFTIMCDGPN